MAGFANTFGVVPGVASASGTLGGALQGGSNAAYGNLSAAKLSVPETGQVKGVGTPDFSRNIQANVPAASGQGFQPTYYNGKQYTSIADLQGAQIADYNATHTQALKQINDAYSQGLLSFDQKQKLIDQSRQNLKTKADQALTDYNQGVQTLGQNKEATLNNQSGYFNSISPDAVQSQQGVMAKKVEDQYNQDLANANTTKTNNDTQFAQAGQGLDLSQSQLGLDRTNYDTNYQNSITATDKALTGQVDAAKNAATAFASSQPTGSTVNYDPVALTNSIAGYFINAQTAGLNGDQAQSAVLSQLTKPVKEGGNGLTAAQASPYINYVYGQVTDPTTQFGKSYANKQPFAIAPTG